MKGVGGLLFKMTRNSINCYFYNNKIFIVFIKILELKLKFSWIFKILSLN